MKRPTKALSIAVFDELNARLSRRQRNKTTPGWTYLPQVPEIKCADGLTMSVQASETHYCTPRDNTGPWTAVEVGFPSRRVRALMPYAETKSNPTGTVYAWVPIGIVAQVIAWHGGFAPTEMDRLVAEFTGKVTEDE